jgi:hypothetical protein
MEPNKCTHYNKLWIYLFKCFIWFFKVQWIQKNQGVMVPSGTTQGNSYP